MPQALEFSIGADTKGLAGDLARASSMFKTFGGNIGKSLSGGMAQATAAISGGALAATLKDIVSEYARVQDLADRFGEKSASALARVGVAAKLAGSDMETVARSLSKATINAKAATSGNEELAGAFDQLGINAGDFVNMSADQKLLAVSTGLQGVKGDGDQLAVALKVLGTRGAELVPLLKAGPDALREAMEGASVATDDTIKKMALLDDQLDETTQTIRTGLGTAFIWTKDQVQALSAATVSFGFEGVKWVDEVAEATRGLNGDLLKSLATLQLLGDPKSMIAKMAIGAWGPTQEALADLNTPKEPPKITPGLGDDGEQRGAGGSSGGSSSPKGPSTEDSIRAVIEAFQQKEALAQADKDYGNQPKAETTEEKIKKAMDASSVAATLEEMNRQFGKGIPQEEKDIAALIDKNLADPLFNLNKDILDRFDKMFGSNTNKSNGSGGTGSGGGSTVNPNAAVARRPRADKISGAKYSDTYENGKNASGKAINDPIDVRTSRMKDADKKKEEEAEERKGKNKEEAESRSPGEKGSSSSSVSQIAAQVYALMKQIAGKIPTANLS